MSEALLSRASSVFAGVVDRKTLTGVVVGAAVMLSALANAQSAGGSWFSGLFSTGGAGGGSGTALISQQDSVVATAINQQATDCANGAPGTIGEAIKTAMNVHGEMASATPNVESLFSVNNNCFSSIGQIFDLSFSIPSLQSILSAAQDAVIAYAQKQVCTAVNQVTGMVTTPINQAIGNINQIQGFTNINGMANSAIGGAMSSIDPQLGSSYHGTAAGGTYTSNTNPFNNGQTTFDGTGGSGTGLNNNTAQINALMQQIGAQQIRINQDQMNLQAAQNAYNACAGGEFDCSAAQAALQQAQQQLAADQATLTSLQTQLAGVVTQTQAQPTGTTVGARSAPAAARTATGAAANGNTNNTSGGSWWSGAARLFN